MENSGNDPCECPVDVNLLVVPASNELWYDPLQHLACHLATRFISEEQAEISSPTPADDHITTYRMLEK